MAIDLPINSPLTDTQGELTSKIGSMKNILALPKKKNRNIPKGNQISTYDYLLKILDSMGISPEIVLNAFLSKVFDITGTFLEEKVLDAIGNSIGEGGVQISPYTHNSNPSASEKKLYKASNRTHIKTLVPVTFLQVAKQKIAKDLLIMIFGQPKMTPNSLNTNQTEVDMLLSNAVCGEGLISLSNDPIIRNQDIEYNKIKLKQQLDKGEVQFEISCQTVKIILPEDPGFIFVGGGPGGSSPTVPPTPAQSLQFTVQYVNNQTQRINNESNANKSGKKFLQILIEKLLGFISTLVQGYLPNVFASINSTLPLSQQLQMGDFIYSNCDIANDATGSSLKKEFTRSLFNALLKDLLKLLLLFVIKKFKQLVVNYFASTALEKQKRKLEKLKMKHKVFSKIADNADKIQKYQVALSTLNSVLESVA